MFIINQSMCVDENIKNRALQYLDQIYSMALYLTQDQHQAELMVERTYSLACQWMQKIDPGELKVWLFKVLMHHYKIFYQTHGKKPKNSGSEPQRASSPRKNRGAMEPIEILSNFKPVSDIFLPAILLVDMHGFSYTEAASILDCSVQLLRKGVSRARKQLSSLLNSIQSAIH